MFMICKLCWLLFFFFKLKTAYEMRISDWSSDVCSSDLPNAYIYFITQAPVWEKICDVIGKPEWKTDPEYAKPEARLPKLRHIFDTIEQWKMTKTKFELMDILNKYDIPCGPST